MVFKWWGIIKNINIYYLKNGKKVKNLSLNSVYRKGMLKFIIIMILIIKGKLKFYLNGLFIYIRIIIIF